MYIETLKSLLENEGLNANTILYRYTNAHHIMTAEDGSAFIKANPDPPEIVIDHYAQGHLIPARELGPGLALSLIHI